MKRKTAISRRKFTGPWDEIKYLRGKLLFWFYERGDHRKAQQITSRMIPLLKKVAGDTKSFLLHECWSLVHEVQGDLEKAIESRRREIELMKELLKEAEHSRQKAEILKHCDYSDLSDQLDLLAILHRDSGDLDTAIAVLEDSKRLCRKHRIEFDAQDELDDYLAERGQRRQSAKADKSSRPRDDAIEQHPESRLKSYRGGLCKQPVG